MGIQQRKKTIYNYNYFKIAITKSDLTMSSRFFIAYRHEFLAFQYLVLIYDSKNDNVKLNIVSEISL